MTAKVDQILNELKGEYKADNLAGMARYGIKVDKTFGATVPTLRAIAKRTGKDHALALELWETGYREGRILAALIDDPQQVSLRQMENWVKEFDSWDVCDGVCCNLFDKTTLAYDKAKQWCRREEEFVRRAGFAIIAALAVHDKKASNDELLQFLPLITKYSVDERNFVKKAVNWALRQIGKRNTLLNKRAIAAAKNIQKVDSRSARWIAADALRELRSEKVQQALKKKSKSPVK
jgi:3-methyladenine DNA glycosylase AlkD